MTERFKPGEGDWVCAEAQCGNINFARRSECNRCGVGRSDGGGAETKKVGIEIGKSMAEKSNGLFSAEDWQCKSCGNVNWARRSTCNVCNAPKFMKTEQRTGFGGGYMERDLNVEYKEKEESDSEFDEFGRRKKKRGGMGGSGNGSAASSDSLLMPTLSASPLVERATADFKPTNDKEAEKSTAKPKFDEEEEDDDDDDDEDVDLSKYQLDDDDDEDLVAVQKGVEGGGKNAEGSDKKRSRSDSSSSSSSSDSSSSSSSDSSSDSPSKSKQTDVTGDRRKVLQKRHKRSSSSSSGGSDSREGNDEKPGGKRTRRRSRFGSRPPRLVDIPSLTVLSRVTC